MTAGRAGVAVLAALVLVAPAIGAAHASEATAGAGDPPALVGGSASGTGVFVTYSDQDTVIEGGTVVPPDVAGSSAVAAIDLTGRASALAALGYSPYVEAPGLVNAFAGTELPLGAVGDSFRAKVSGYPTQEAQAPAPGERAAARARARIVDGPRAEAETAAADAAPPGIAVRVGHARAVVDTGGGAGAGVATVVLRDVKVGEDLAFETVRLAVHAVADGAAGLATASSTVTGVTVRGRAVRLTPRGLEPLGPAPDPGGSPSGSGVEVVATGSEAADPGAGQADASASGPRLRLSSPDGRVLDVVLGRASASSTHVPPPDDDRTEAGAAGVSAAAVAGGRRRAGLAVAV